jgi:uncharacterized protein YndB with AHSA1/START domain
MSSDRFVYVTYIATTAEKVFKALIEGETTRQYWKGMENVSDWKEGSTWQHRDPARTVRVVGKVIEIRPPHRLVLSWVDPAKADEPAQHSRVTFAIEPLKDAVKLTVTHEDFVAGSAMFGPISQGWPCVLSNLKSLLETGRTLDIWSGCGK